MYSVADPLQNREAAAALLTCLASEKHLYRFISHCRMPQILGIFSPHDDKLSVSLLISFWGGGKYSMYGAFLQAIRTEELAGMRIICGCSPLRLWVRCDRQLRLSLSILT